MIHHSFAGDQGREVFQVTFGTRPYLGQRSPTTDGGRFLVAANDGDIIVAGHGASTFTDTGDRTKPMITRIAADVHVSNDWVSDIFLPERNRIAYIEPVAAPHLPQFIIEVEDQLQTQEPRRE